MAHTGLLDDIGVSLMREASMSSMLIGTGLTHIRRYDFASYGYFYSALSTFTSGIERLAKIILIYDYRLYKDEFPRNDYLKDVGHKLAKLLIRVREINLAQGLDIQDDFFDTDPLYNSIISCINDFAVQARYYNLDYLTHKRQAGLEPLTRWNTDICTEIIHRHHKPNKLALARKEAFGRAIDSSGSVSHIREDGSHIRSFADMFNHGDMIPTKQKFSMYYMYTIARFMSRVCAELEYKGNYFPYLREFYTIYTITDRAYILRKKVWNPMNPW